MSLEKIQVNPAVLRQVAREAALKGAISAIEEYYNGFNSPYKKEVTNQLMLQPIGNVFKLPDILALINDSLSAQIDAIANTAVAKTFLPLVQTVLTRVEAEINFSDILRKFIQSTQAQIGECSVEITKSKHGWLDCKITAYELKLTYEICLHDNLRYEKKGEPKEAQSYSILSLPYEGSKNHMRVIMDGRTTLELPFTRNVLQDEFVSYIARLVICKSKIIMDCEDFEDYMFEE